MAHFLIFLLLMQSSLIAKDFGFYGKTYPISEESFIDVLRARLSNVDFDAKKEQWISDFKRSVENPKGRKLPRATKEKKFSFDPSIIAQQDIRDLEGNVIVSKGTKINPLDKYVMPEALLFFDGTDKDQVTWACSRKGVWILTLGNPIELELQEKRPVYFDQSGYLCGKMGIKALPASVRQDEKIISIEEMPCF